MQIRYSAYYKTENGHTRIINGKLDDIDIQNAIKNKESRETIDNIKVLFKAATVDSVDLD